VASPEAEARVLTANTLGIEPKDLVLARPLTDAETALLATQTEQRVVGVPLQHLTGRAYFRTVSLRVGPGVFIPRPETETLAGWAIDAVKAGCHRVVELCAGSGAISLAIAHEAHPAAQWAVEADAAAYAFLTENLTGSGVHSVLGDMAEALPGLDGTIDLVVANPPYIPETARDTLPPEVRRDPDRALFSGADGLDAVAVVAATARRLLRAGGVVGCEHGEDQGETVRALFAAAGFTGPRTHEDLTDRPRYTVAGLPTWNDGPYERRTRTN
jgi:release factor glutamine methyltransferase